MVYTVNPDGSARVNIDVVTGMPLNPFGGGDVGAKKPEDESLDGLRRRAIRSTLESPGVAAWKDVFAEFLPNGKLKFKGTAYLKRVEDFQAQGGGIPILGPALRMERAEGGSFKLVAIADGQDGLGSSRRKPKTAEEIRKLTDEELDRHIHLDLIDLQSTKPLVTAFLTDAKLKTTYVLPGEVTESEGFARDGQKASFTLDGAGRSPLSPRPSTRTARRGERSTAERPPPARFRPWSSTFQSRPHQSRSPGRPARSSTSTRRLRRPSLPIPICARSLGSVRT